MAESPTRRTGRPMRWVSAVTLADLTAVADLSPGNDDGMSRNGGMPSAWPVGWARSLPPAVPRPLPVRTVLPVLLTPLTTVDSLVVDTACLQRSGRPQSRLC